MKVPWSREEKAALTVVVCAVALLALISLPFCLGCVVTTRGDSGVGIEAGWKLEIYQRGPDEGADIRLDLHSWVQELIKEAKDDAGTEGSPDDND